jgi:hypothetical protein
MRTESVGRAGAGRVLVLLGLAGPRHGLPTGEGREAKLGRLAWNLAHGQ